MGGISIYDLVSFSVFFFSLYVVHRNLCVLTHSFPTRRSSSLRARLRQALRSQTILDPQAAARSAAWLADADAAIDWAVAGAIASWAETDDGRSEEHTSELQSLMRIWYAVVCLNKRDHKQHVSRSTTTHRTHTHDIHTTS